MARLIEHALKLLRRLSGNSHCYQELVGRFRTAIDRAARSHAAYVLAEKGHEIQRLGRHEDAIAIYDALVARFGGVNDREVQQQVAYALASKGYALEMLGRYDEAIAVCDEVIKRFGDATGTSLRERVLDLSSSLDTRKQFPLTIMWWRALARTLSLVSGSRSQGRWWTRDMHCRCSTDGTRRSRFTMSY
jgi:tetratricopeptide (TPR) repeat protein